MIVGFAVFFSFYTQINIISIPPNWLYGHPFNLSRIGTDGLSSKLRGDTIFQVEYSIHIEIRYTVYFDIKYKET